MTSPHVLRCSTTAVDQSAMGTFRLGSDPFKQIETLTVKSYDVYLRTTLFQFSDHLIESANSTLIPDMR